MRTFNTTGPCRPELHYMLPPLARAPGAMELVRAQRYLAVNGPRQSGKTSLVRALVDAVNRDGWARAVVLSAEVSDPSAGVVEVDAAERALVSHWLTAMALQWPEARGAVEQAVSRAAEHGRLFAFMSAAAVASDKPLVVVIDEIDTLARRPFISALRQIRDGFQFRPAGFPHSVVLSGMRHLRDHDIALGGDGGGSPFNIVEFISLGNFSQDDVVALYGQHTGGTGQRFSDAAIAMVWDQTRGQPWLVNAIANHCVSTLVPDRSQVVDDADVEEAIRLVEHGNTTHLRSLSRRLAEDRVMRVVAPVVAGDQPKVSEDDERYAVEVGLLERVSADVLRPANPIYARALLRSFAEPERKQLVHWSPSWLVDGRIDLDRLRDNFLAFWKLNRNMMKVRITYPEAVAHFGLMTYLDRVANGGGRVDREFAVGRGRLDLLLHHGATRLPIEVKVHRDHGGDPVPDGVAQLDRYCEGLGVDRSWLVVFDQRSGATGTRLEHEELISPSGRRVLVVRA